MAHSHLKRGKIHFNCLHICSNSIMTSQIVDWLIKFLHPTRHKIGHFGDVFTANNLAKYWQTKTNTANILQHKMNPPPKKKPG